MDCSRCGLANPANQKFCGECGLALPAATPADGLALRSYTPHHLAADGIVGARSTVEGERKQVTVLFCDVAGSTSLAERIGAERMHGLLDTFFALAVDKVHAFEGTVNQFLGDGFMALFGAPRAHEDHARRAVLAALALREQLAVHRAQGSLPDGFQVRMGLNTGLVVVGRIGDELRMDYTAIGDTTNTAARLQGTAQPGEIVIGEEVRRQVGDHVELVSREPRRLKGKAGLVSSYAVLGVRSPLHPHSRDRGPMIGRDGELAAIGERLDVLRQGEGGIVTLAGEAGLGKSCLLAAARRLAEEKGVAWFEGGCVSYGKALSYWPFREVLRRCFDIADNADDATSMTRLHGALEPLFGDEAGVLAAYLGAVLGLQLGGRDAERVDNLDRVAVGHQIFRTSFRVFERLASQAPQVIALDDWQWVDDSSAELLEHLLALTARVPLLFVIAGRPAEHGAVASLARALANEGVVPIGRHCELVLEPLPEVGARQLVSDLLQGGTLPSRLQERLTRQAQGNPFYLGELVRALVAAQAIERDPRTGTWQATGNVDTLDVPGSIEAVILARVDRLPDDAKRVLKTAAVIGRSFLRRVLADVVDASAGLDACLAALESAELVERKRQAPEPEWMFRHPLIQQATYGTLLEDRRRQLHRRVARSVETLFAARLEEFSPLLAHHYAQADAWDQAQRFLLMAGNHARRVAADAEALDHYQRALLASSRATHRLDAVARGELEICMGEALWALGRHEPAVRHACSAFAAVGIDYPTARGHIRRSIAVKVLALGRRRLFDPLRRHAEAQDPDTRQPAQWVAARALQLIGYVDYFSDPERLLLDVLAGLEMAEKRPRSREYALSNGGVALVFDTLGFYRLASTFHVRALRMARRLDDELAVGACCLWLGTHRVSTGRWAGAERTLYASEAHSRAAGHLRNAAAALSTRISLHRAMGDPRWVRESHELRAVALEANDDQAVAWGLQWIGTSRLDVGDFAGAVAEFEAACALFEAVTDFRAQAGALSQWALGLVELGDIDGARKVLEKSQAIVAKYHMSGFWSTLPLMYTAEAYLRIVETGPAGAERARAIASAKSACARATQHGRRIADGSAADALRLCGVHAWLTGRTQLAEQRWRRGLALAAALNAKHAVARLHHELGTRSDLPAHRRSAETLFAEMRVPEARAST